MELEETSTPFEPVEDSRPKLPPIPPVYLVAINEVRLPAQAGLEKLLDAFYVGLFHMDREAGPTISYRTANFRLLFEIYERPPERQDYRPLGMVVPSLTELVGRLVERNISHVRHAGLWTGSDRVVLNDPAGNIMDVTETGMSI